MATFGSVGVDFIHNSFNYSEQTQQSFQFSSTTYNIYIKLIESVSEVYSSSICPTISRSKFKFKVSLKYYTNRKIKSIPPLL